MARAHRWQRGWTLFELMVVTVIVGVSAAIMVPSATGQDDQRVALAAEQVASALMFARDESIRTSAPHGVNIEDGANRIRVFRADMGSTPLTPIYDVYHPVSKGLWDVDLDTHDLARGVNITTTPTWRGSCSSPTLTVFMSAATPACADTVSVVVTQIDIALSKGSVSQTVRLDGITARVHLP